MTSVASDRGFCGSSVVETSATGADFGPHLVRLVGSALFAALLDGPKRHNEEHITRFGQKPLRALWVARNPTLGFVFTARAQTTGAFRSNCLPTGRRLLRRRRERAILLKPAAIGNPHPGRLQLRPSCSVREAPARPSRAKSQLVGTLEGRATNHHPRQACHLHFGHGEVVGGQ